MELRLPRDGSGVDGGDDSDAKLRSESVARDSDCRSLSNGSVSIIASFAVVETLLLFTGVVGNDRTVGVGPISERRRCRHSMRTTEDTVVRGIPFSASQCMSEGKDNCCCCWWWWDGSDIPRTRHRRVLERDCWVVESFSPPN